MKTGKSNGEFYAETEAKACPQHPVNEMTTEQLQAERAAIVPGYPSRMTPYESGRMRALEMELRARLGLVGTFYRTGYHVAERTGLEMAADRIVAAVPATDYEMADRIVAALNLAKAARDVLATGGVLSAETRAASDDTEQAEASVAAVKAYWSALNVVREG